MTMKQLRLKSDVARASRNRSDVERIVLALWGAGYLIHQDLAARAWSEWCEETMCASWLTPPADDAEIVAAVLYVCDVIE